MNRKVTERRKAERKSEDVKSENDKMESPRVRELEQLRRNTIGSLRVIEKLLAQERASAKN